MPEPSDVALDATYSIGNALSGVGVYSREILSGLAAAHPGARDFPPTRADVSSRSPSSPAAPIFSTA